MKTLIRCSLFLALLLPCLLSATPQAQSFRVAPSYFPNKGQVSDKSVTWYSRGANVSLYLRGTTLTYVLHHRPKSASDDLMKRPHELDETASIVDRVDVELVGANPHYEILAEAKQAGVFHFYLPQCSPGLRDVPHYGRVVCRDVWPGVDLVLGGQGDALKYDFVVKPGADAGQIRMRYAGQGPNLTPDGGLTRPTLAGDLRESAPVAWTTAPDGSRTPVAASWQLAEDGQPSFALGAYDAKQPLTIDPVVWGMYLGGENNDNINAVASTPEGGVYAGGLTISYHFKNLSGALNGNGDAVIMNFSAAGDLVWGFYLGGSSYESIDVLRTAPNRGVFAGGNTTSNNFVGLNGRNGGRSDGFLAFFSTEGDLIWGNYVGGESSDYVVALCPATDGGVFAGGNTSSNDFVGLTSGPKGGTDGFLIRYSATGNMVWGKYIGGSSADFVRALCPAPDGDLYIGGETQSSSFVGLNGIKKGLLDGFLMRWTADADMIWGMFVGGGEWERIHALSTAPDGGVYAGGFTNSTDFEGLKSSFKGGEDGFVTRYTAAGDFVWGSYLGGSGLETIFALSSAPDGGVFAGGETRSVDFEGLSGGFGGVRDGFLTRFSAEGDLLWGNYAGRSADERIDDLCPGPDGSVFAVGYTHSVGFEGLSDGYKGERDGFILNHSGWPTARPITPAPLPLSLAPNPAADQAYISLNLESGGPGILEAYDAAGRLVHSRRLALQAGDNRLELDLNGWPAGVYSVRLSTEKSEYAGRLVKN